MNWNDITWYVGICTYTILAIICVIEWKKKSPQNYSDKQLLRIEILILLIFFLIITPKITIVIGVS